MKRVRPAKGANPRTFPQYAKEVGALLVHGHHYSRARASRSLGAWKGFVRESWKSGKAPCWTSDHVSKYDARGEKPRAGGYRRDDSPITQRSSTLPPLPPIRPNRSQYAYGIQTRAPAPGRERGSYFYKGARRVRRDPYLVQIAGRWYSGSELDEIRRKLISEAPEMKRQVLRAPPKRLVMMWKTWNR